MIRISQSRVKTWRSCKYQHWLKYHRKLQRRRIKRPLKFGTIVHNMIEEYANLKDPFVYLDDLAETDQAMFKMEREEYGDLINDIDVIMSDYFEYWGDDLDYVKINGKYAEHKIEIEVMKDVIWACKIDAVTKTPNKLVWLTEHKSFNQMPTEDNRWRNIQSTTYHRALDIMGWQAVDGSVWDYIWSKPPTAPEITKTGKISERAIRTLPTKLKRWKKETGNPIPGTLMAKAKESRSDWFQRIYLTKKKKTIEMVWEDFETSIKEIVERGEKEKTRCIERHCSWCDYEAICRAELTGSDVDFIIEKEYKVDDPDLRYQDTE